MTRPEAEVMKIVEEWGNKDIKEIALCYSRGELEELFYSVYGYYPISSLFKTKTSIVRQLRDRRNTMERASAFQNAGRGVSSAAVGQMNLEAPKTVEHTYNVTYHRRSGEVVTQVMRSATMGSLVKKLENTGAEVWKVERGD